MIDGLNGRSVNTVLERITQGAAARGEVPSRVVIALGTNDSSVWGPSDYRAIQKALPRATILFVTPWRDTSYVRNRGRGTTMAGYAASMRNLAAKFRHVCVADWAKRVQHTPRTYLVDGVHQNAYGLRVWSWMVASRMDDCVAGRE